MNTQKTAGYFTATTAHGQRPVLKIEKQSAVSSTSSWWILFNHVHRLATQLTRTTLQILVAIATTELKRRVAPGRRSEERYQFESPEARQGTWGRIL
ncbi:MAG: hypothetical protein IPJ84_16150 [Bdellovibrionales bacterium]|nr:hypothetical protein [Bdellovibrionales bacterium]